MQYFLVKCKLDMCNGASYQWLREKKKLASWKSRKNRLTNKRLKAELYFWL